MALNGRFLLLNQTYEAARHRSVARAIIMTLRPRSSSRNGRRSVLRSHMMSFPCLR